MLDRLEAVFRGAPGAVGWAIGIQAALFGLAHAYQGPGGIVKTGGIGLVLAGLAIATGGLLAPMLVHAAVDLSSGQVAYLVLGEGDGREPEAREGRCPG